MPLTPDDNKTPQPTPTNEGFKRAIVDKYVDKVIFSKSVINTSRYTNRSITANRKEDIRNERDIAKLDQNIFNLFGSIPRRSAANLESRYAFQTF